MKVIKVIAKWQLKELYDDSALSIEGLKADEENLTALINWVKERTPLKREVVYTIEGNVMNRKYGLTGDNAYPNENFTIVCIKLADMEDFNAIVKPRFDIGGRWFDDIVNNNAAREDND
jgi:hypothetical protein